MLRPLFTSVSEDIAIDTSSSEQIEINSEDFSSDDFIPINDSRELTPIKKVRKRFYEYTNYLRKKKTIFIGEASIIFQDVSDTKM